MTSDGKQSPERERGVKKTKDDSERYNIRHTQYDTCPDVFYRDTQYAIRYASVAELADAQGLGPCVLRDVEVRILSLAFLSRRCFYYKCT